MNFKAPIYHCVLNRDMKSELDEEDARRQFVTAHAKRLKNKLMDAKVEEHMLKMVCFSKSDIMLIFTLSC
jgi:hypothetical protein